jgi:hypothetical protein
MMDIRATGSKTSFLHYLHKLITQRSPDLLEVAAEISNLSDASKGKKINLWQTVIPP